MLREEHGSVTSAPTDTLKLLLCKDIDDGVTMEKKSLFDPPFMPPAVKQCFIKGEQSFQA